MKKQLTRNENATVAPTASVKPAFFNPDTLPWTPWVIEGTEFKLLNVNPQTGGFTMLLLVEPGNLAPVHGHIGAVEGVILSGGFGYDDDRGREGYYVLESGGISHRPDTDDDGMIMFAVMHGPLVGYEDDGGVAGIVDGKAMYQLAEDNNAASHIERPPEWA